MTKLNTKSFFKKSAGLALLLTLFLSIISCTGNQKAKTLSHEEILKIATEAYEYALPLISMDLNMKFGTITKKTGGVPINQFDHSKIVYTPEHRTGTMHNVDVLYSVAFFDLENEPIVLEMPETEIYSSMVITDAYGNFAAVLGTGGIDDGKAAVYLLCGPFYEGEIPDGMTKVSIPTNLSVLIGRTAYTGDNLSEIHGIQEKLTLTPLSEYGNPNYVLPAGSYNPEYDVAPLKKLFDMDIETFFNAFNKLVKTNPGTAEDEPVLKQFAKIGVGPGLEFRLEKFPDETKEALRNIPALAQDKFTKVDMKDPNPNFYRLINNWIYYNFDDLARFGTNYEYRALISIIGIGINPGEIAVYPMAVVDKNLEALDGNNKYTIRFEKGQLPPCKAFWSVTVYGEDLFLPANNLINKYSVRGTDNFVYNSDGSLEIYIQYESPGKNLEANWLPVPQSGFRLVMRMYQPEESVIDFTWQPPFIVKR